MKRPAVRWAETADGLQVAFQTLGDGPVDLAISPSQYFNLDAIWDDPALDRFLRRLASFSRLILHNPRGSGVSDPAPRGGWVVEELVTDLHAVLDAVGSKRAALLAIEAGGFQGIPFSATAPERVHALLLLNAFATWRRSDDYPVGFPDKALETFIEMSLTSHGSAGSLRWIAPELHDDERFRESYARLERLTSSPSVLRKQVVEGTSNFDVRGILSGIRAPTLVMCHTAHPWLRSGHSLYLADNIADARYVERDGLWSVFWMHDVDWVAEEIQAFLTGTRGGSDLDDRVLATVLFTDIVASTQRAAALGDRRWRHLLDDHDTVVRREIEGFRGRAVKSTGDGIMATFDGPARAIRCAVAIGEAVRSLGLEVRTGVHTGEVVQRGEDVGGIAVHIAARVMNEARPNEVLVSGAVPPLVAGSGLEFDDRGEHTLKGVPGEWRLYAVRS
ncbi:MAG: alpha/beta fold hydrolase [Actinomycetota bacterium]